MMKLKALNVRMPEKLKTEFDQVCEKNHVNVSALVRSWIEVYVRDNQKEENQG